MRFYKRGELERSTPLLPVRHEASIKLADESSAEEGMPPTSYRVFGYAKVTMCIKRKTEKLQAVNVS